MKEKTVAELLLKIDDGDNQDIHIEILSRFAILEAENKELKEQVKNLEESLEIQADRVDALIEEKIDLEEKVEQGL